MTEEHAKSDADSLQMGAKMRGQRFLLTSSDEDPPVDDEPDFGRRYDSRDVCTPCWYDNCRGCRGSGCACRIFNHPDPT